MKNKLIILIILLLLILGSLWLYSAFRPEEAAEAPVQTVVPTADPIPTTTPEPIVLTLAHCLEQNGSLDIAADRWAERVNDLTDGQLTIEIYPQAQLFNEQGGREAVRSGQVDIIIADINDFAAYVPACELYSLPFLFTGYPDAAKLLYGDVGAQIDMELEIQCGVKPLGWAWNGFRELYMPGWANSVYTCANINMRCGGDEISLDTFRLLGMNPQVISWSKTYAAIEDGTVDGAEVRLKNLYDENYVRLGKQLVISRHRLSVAGPVFNSAVWNGLDNNLKDILQKTWFECREELNDTVSISEDALAAKLVELGCNWVEFGVRADNVRTFSPYWADRAASGGYSGLLNTALRRLGIE